MWIVVTELMRTSYVILEFRIVLKCTYKGVWVRVAWLLQFCCSLASEDLLSFSSKTTDTCNFFVYISYLYQTIATRIPVWHFLLTPSWSVSITLEIYSWNFMCLTRFFSTWFNREIDKSCRVPRHLLAAGECWDEGVAKTGDKSIA